MVDLNLLFKWVLITTIVAVIMVGIYKTTELAFDRMERMQEVSRQVIER